MTEIATKEWREVISATWCEIKKHTLLLIAPFDVLITLTIFPAIGLLAGLVWFLSLGHLKQALTLLEYSGRRVLVCLLLPYIDDEPTRRRNENM